MKSLTGYLSEQAGKNTHMTHIEDLVLDGGVKGARQAILALRSLRDMLSGNAKSSTDVTVKWDGAPAVFAGEDPQTGEFFVAKKGVFNANPKVYKNHDDIDNDTSSVSGKLSFGSSNAVSGYTNSNTAAGFSAVDVDGTYSSTTSNNNVRIGLLDGSTAVTGDLNEDVSAEKNPPLQDRDIVYVQSTSFNKVTKGLSTVTEPISSIVTAITLFKILSLVWVIIRSMSPLSDLLRRYEPTI